MTESDGYDDRGDNNHDLISQNNKKKRAYSNENDDS